MYRHTPGLRSRPALVLLTLFAAVLACAGPNPAPATPTEAVPPPPTAPPTPRPRTAGELASATVQVVALVSGGASYTPVGSGSGSVISADGLILTNAHVVDDRYGDYTVLGVAVLTDTDSPPALVYLPELAAGTH